MEVYGYGQKKKKKNLESGVKMTHIIILQSPKFTLRFTLGVRSVGLDRCIMTRIYHYSTIQSIFITLKILCASSIHPSRPSQPLATTSLFMFPIVLPFPECHFVGIIQYVVFSDWFLSLSSMHLNFLHVFSWFDSSFPFCTQ